MSSYQYRNRDSDYDKHDRDQYNSAQSRREVNDRYNNTHSKRDDYDPYSGSLSRRDDHDPYSGSLSRRDEKDRYGHRGDYSSATVPKYDPMYSDYSPRSRSKSDRDKGHSARYPSHSSERFVESKDSKFPPSSSYRLSSDRDPINQHHNSKSRIPSRSDHFDSTKPTRSRSPVRKKSKEIVIDLTEPEESNFISEVSLGSSIALKIHRQFENTVFQPVAQLLRDFALTHIYSLDNPELNKRFESMQSELQSLSTTGGFPPGEINSESHYGFLATINPELMKRVAREGLSTTMCPINILGHCVSGVHLCFHGDVCLRQAAEEASSSKVIYLVMFKFMFGRKHRVAASDGFFLLAPTPNMHSHVSGQSIATADSLSDQHKKSLVYLYEFKNHYFHPVSRPRLCCPIATLQFERQERFATDLPLFDSLTSPFACNPMPLFMPSLSVTVTQPKPVSHQQSVRSTSNITLVDSGSRRDVNRLFEIKK